MTFIFYEDEEKIIQSNNQDEFIKKLKGIYKTEFIDWLTEHRGELNDDDFSSELESCIKTYNGNDLFELLEETKSYCGLFWYEITSD